MEIYASQRYVRQAPRKVRLVANAVKDMPLEQAFRQLSVLQRSASLPVMKTLRQAVANAQHNHHLDPKELKIKSIVVENGPIYKRFRAVSRGRAHSIQKKTCHIVVRLEQTAVDTVGTTSVASTKTSAKATAPVKAASKAAPAKTTAARAAKKTAAAPAKKVKTQEKNTQK